MSLQIPIKITYKNRNGTNFKSKTVKQKEDTQIVTLEETTLELAGFVPDYRGDDIAYYTDGKRSCLYTLYGQGTIADIEFWDHGDRWEDMVARNQERVQKFVWDTPTQKVFLRNISVPVFRITSQGAWGNYRASVGWGYWDTRDLNSTQWAKYFPVTEPQKMLTYLHAWAARNPSFALDPDKSFGNLNILIPEPFQLDIVGILRDMEVARLSKYQEEDMAKLTDARKKVTDLEKDIAERKAKIADTQANFNPYHIRED